MRAISGDKTRTPTAGDNRRQNPVPAAVLHVQLQLQPYSFPSRVHLAQEEKRREDAPSHPMVGIPWLGIFFSFFLGTGTGGPHFTWERDTTGPPAAGPVSGPDRSLTTTVAGSRQQDSPSQFAVDSDSPRRHPSLHSQKCDPAAAAAAAPQQLQG